MTELPAGWTEVTIGEVSDVILGQSPPGTSYNRDGEGLPFFQGKKEFGELHPTVQQWTTEPRKSAEAGDVLVSVRAPVGATNLADQDCCIGRGLAALRPSNATSTKFMLWATRRYEHDLAALGTGSTFTAISGKTLRGFPIPLPPLAEQERIVAAIEEHFSHLDAAEASLHRALTRLPTVASQLLDRVVHGAQMGAPDFTRPDPGDPLPDGWCWRGLDELGELGRGKSKHRPRNDPALYGGEYPFVQTGDVANAGRTLTGFSQTYSEAGLAQSKLWPAGTLAVTIAANIADTTILGFEACFPDSVVGFVADEDLVDAAWVEAFMRTAKENLERYAPATAQKNINLKTLREVRVPTPPLDAQARVLASLTEAEERLGRVAEDLEKSLLRAEHLRRGVLAAAFSGRLVPQDASDEPASVSLERIRAEVPAKKKSTRKRKPA